MATAVDAACISARFTLGIVVGSTRPGCNGKSIAHWVASVVSPELQEHVDLRVVDLAAWNLLLLDEPGVPAAGQEPVHAHTKAWQREVDSIQAFLFVTPQARDKS